MQQNNKAMEQKFTKNDRVIQIGTLHKYTVQDVQPLQEGYEYTLIDDNHEILRTSGNGFKNIKDAKYALVIFDYNDGLDKMPTKHYFKTEDEAMEAYHKEVQNHIEAFVKEGYKHCELERGFYSAIKLYGDNKRMIHIRVESI